MEKIFWNIEDIITINTRLRDGLNERQSHHAIVEGFADIFLEFMSHLEPFVSYGAQRIHGKALLEAEMRQNEALASFVKVFSGLLPEIVLFSWLFPEDRKLVRITESRPAYIPRETDHTSCTLYSPVGGGV